ARRGYPGRRGGAAGARPGSGCLHHQSDCVAALPDLIHIGLIGPLPPVQTGPADYLANFLPGLARHAELTVFVPDPGAVDRGLRREYRIRALSERDDPAIDVLVYHIANNPEQIPAIDAALEGPPGLLEIHDGSQHHLVAHRFGDFGSLDKYAE